MKISLELEGLLLGAIGSLTVMTTIFAASAFVQTEQPVPTEKPRPVVAMSPARLEITDPVRTGSRLYNLNCAHCHGDDASGDEGPDLHDVRKSNARIASIILHGVKGEMPKFDAKFDDADVQALTAFIRSLKD